MPTARVACRTTAPYSCAAPVALQLAKRHRPRVICHTRHGRSRDAACCMLHVACCMMPPGAHALEASSYARSRATCKRGHSCRYGRGRWGGRAQSLRRTRPHSAFATAATAHTVRSSCTASIAAEQCRLAARRDRGRLQRCREGALGGGDGGEPGRLVHRASESLQGTPQRRRLALVARMLHLCLLRVACANLLAAAARDPLFGSTLFACLLVCLFACLLASGLCKTHHRWRGLRRTRVVAWRWPIRALLRRTALCVRWCAAANPAEPLPHKRTAPVRMRSVTPEGC
jgi:hypothetical protein